MKRKGLVGSNLETCTSSNTTQYEYNTRQHDTTRVQHDTTRDNTVQHETTRVQYDTIRAKHDPTRVQRKLLAAKIGVYFLLFVTELYIFLISFRNS